MKPEEESTDAGAELVTYECRLDRTALGNVLRTGAVIKENNVRRVLRGRVGEITVYAKLFKRRAKRARIEWDNTVRMAEKGLPVPRPLAVGRLAAEEFVVVEGIAGAAEIIPSLRRARRELPPDEFLARKRRYLSAVGKLVRNVHDAGFFHGDLQGGNLLVDVADKIWLIDLHRVRAERVSERRRIRSLARVVMAFRGVWTAGDEQSLLEGYGAPLVWRGPILRGAERMIRKRFRSRTKRCLMNSSRFHVSRIGDCRVFHRREVAPEEMVKVAGMAGSKVRGAEDSREAGDAGCCESQRTDNVGVSERGRTGEARGSRGEQLFVKRYKPGWRGILKATLGFGRGRNAWVAANGLLARGIPTAEPKALVERWRWGLLVEAALVTAKLDLMPLNRFVEETALGPSEKDELTVALARFVRKLHDLGVYHNDLKGHNILVERRTDSDVPEDGGRWTFYLVDLDGLRFGRVSERRRLKNLAQLDVTVPDQLTAEHRRRFMAEYFGSDAPLDEYARRIARLQKGMTRWWKVRREARGATKC